MKLAFPKFTWSLEIIAELHAMWHANIESLYGHGKCINIVIRGVLYGFEPCLKAHNLVNILILM